MFRSPVQLCYSCVCVFPSGHPQDRRAPRTNHWTSRRLLEPVKVSVDIWHAQVIKAHIEHKWIINEYNAHINPMLIQYSCLLRFQIWFQIPGGKSRTRRDLGTTSGIETVHASKNCGAQRFPLKQPDLQFCHEPRRDSLPEARHVVSTNWFSWFEASLNVCKTHLTSDVMCAGWCFRSRGWSWSR